MKLIEVNIVSLKPFKAALASLAHPFGREVLAKLHFYFINNVAKLTGDENLISAGFENLADEVSEIQDTCYRKQISSAFRRLSSLFG